MANVTLLSLVFIHSLLIHTAIHSPNKYLSSAHYVPDTVVGARSTDRSKINTEMNTLPSGNAQSSEDKGHTNKDVPHALIKASKELCLD